MDATIRSILSTLLFLLSFNTVAAIYEWQDAQGNTYFSDTPHKGAKKIEIQEAQVYKPDPKNKKKPKLIGKSPNLSEYTSLKITTPRNNAMVPNRSGDVNVSIDIDPTLKETDKIQLFMDGKAIGEPKHSTIFTMKNVIRGIHTLSVAIINDKGDTLKTSEAVTFNVLRPSTLYGPLHKQKASPTPTPQSAPSPHN